jgi:hypothetical protein
MKSLYLCLAFVFAVLIAELASAQTFRQRTVIRGNGGRRNNADVNVFVNSGFPVQQVNFVPASTFVTPTAIYGVNTFGTFNTFAAPGYGCGGGFAPSGFRSFSVYSGGGCW